MIGLDELNRTVLICRDYLDSRLSDEEICENFQSLKVAIVSDLNNLSSHGGQTALVTLVSLLSRMGMQVGLTVPDVPMRFSQTPISGTSVRDALVAASECFIPGAIIHIDSDFSPDLIFALGDTQVATSTVPFWRLSGDDWGGAVRVESIAEPRRWVAEWPIGAMISAALAANESFKFVMRSMPLREKADLLFFEPSPSCSWTFGFVPLPPAGVRLGQVDVISAGAITQAALYALVRLPGIQMRGRIFDDDITTGPNLNRNMLTLVSDVGSPKVQVVSRRCGLDLVLDPIQSRFSGATSGIRALAERVLVGVDDIPSRWEVQRHARDWVAVSGTSHFSVSSSDHRRHEPCSGCLHSVDDPGGANPIPTISFVSFWAGLAMTVRLIRDAVGLPYPPDRQHLWLTPLRMDSPHAAIWYPIPPCRNCPVHCLASRAA
jgi:hypothetical protein